MEENPTAVSINRGVDHNDSTTVFSLQDHENELQSGNSADPTL